MNYKVLLLYRKLYGRRKRNKCNGKKILLLQMLATGLDESQGFLFYEKNSTITASVSDSNSL